MKKMYFSNVLAGLTLLIIANALPAIENLIVFAVKFIIDLLF